MLLQRTKNIASFRRLEKQYNLRTLRSGEIANMLLHHGGEYDRIAAAALLENPPEFLRTYSRWRYKSFIYTGDLRWVNHICYEAVGWGCPKGISNIVLGLHILWREGENVAGMWVVA